MLLDLEESQLVLVDYQERLIPALFEGTQAIANAVRLARLAALLQVPAVLLEQSPDRLGPTAEPLLEATQALAAARLLRRLPKTHFSGVEDGLSALLRPPVKPAAGNARSLPKHLQKPAQEQNARPSIVLAGCEAHVCLLQTALALLEDEFEVWVVTDACSSRTERNRDAAFDRLAGAGAELLTTEMVAFEWLRHADHPQFRAVQALIK
jgi:nicotinamidase-related amidase